MEPVELVAVAGQGCGHDEPVGREHLLGSDTAAYT